VAALCATVILGIAFALVERRRSYPMFDLTLFRRPAFLGASIAALVLSISYWGIFLYTPLYLQISHGYSPLHAGLAALPFALPGLLVPKLGEYLAHRMRGGTLLALGQFVVAAGTLWLFLAVSAGSGWPAIVGGGQLHTLSREVVAGSVDAAAGRLPGGSRKAFLNASQNSFFSGLHLILAVAAATALIGAGATYFLTRSGRDEPADVIAADCRHAETRVGAYS
jgi:hypothetical protein